MTNRRPDQYQNIRQAGAIPKGNQETSLQCMRPDLFEQKRETTPEHIKKYRQSYKQEPGIILVHPGLKADAEAIDRTKGFGKQTGISETLGAVLKCQQLNGLADKFNDIKESKYQTHQKEPLGQTYTRNYEWPTTIKQQPDFAFGVGSNRCESAKDLLFPRGGAMEEKPEFTKMYEKTHGNFGAGAQRSREYNWSIDPTQHVFGYGERPQPNQAGNAIHSERVEETFPKTVIVKKLVEDAHQVQKDHLGSSKNLGQGLQPQVRNEMVFGVPSLKDHTEWNAGACIRGQATAKELMADADLGRCTKPGSRNQVRTPLDSNRAFGCPTIRTDIPMKVFKSVADHQNYGDEPEAIDILFPSTNLELGVTEADFQKIRTKADLRTMFERIGYSYKPGKFNAIFNRSVQISQEHYQKQIPENYSTARGMMLAVQELHEQ